MGEPYKPMPGQAIRRCPKCGYVKEWGVEFRQCEQCDPQGATGPRDAPEVPEATRLLVEAARLEERAAVVAWLRGVGKKESKNLASWIEDGAHIRARTQTPGTPGEAAGCKDCATMANFVRQVCCRLPPPTPAPDAEALRREGRMQERADFFAFLDKYNWAHLGWVAFKAAVKKGDHESPGDRDGRGTP